MSAQQWYMAVGGNQLGPVSEQEVISEHRERHGRRQHAGVHRRHDQLDADLGGAVAGART